MGLFLQKAKTDDDVKNELANQELFKNFNPTKKIGTFIEFDEEKRQWLIPDGFMGKKKNPKIHSYDEIIDCELLEDGDSLTKGGLGRAVAGGILFGGVGAVVGGVTGGKKTKSIVNSLRIKITLNSMSDPVTYINLITTPTKTSSFVYKSIEEIAQQILSVFSVILQEKDAGTESQANSSADEIRKYKELLDDGIITQEEFDVKKKQLLGL